MTKCSRCGKDLGGSESCPACGGPPSQSVLEKGISRTARVTGKVIDKTVDVTEEVVRETKPVVKRAVDLGKRGVTKAKEKTREVAKDLQEKS